MARAECLPDCNAATVTSSNSNELTAAVNTAVSKNVRRVMAERILYFSMLEWGRSPTCRFIVWQVGDLPHFAFRTIRGRVRPYRSPPPIYRGAGARCGGSATHNRCHAAWIAGYY